MTIRNSSVRLLALFLQEYWYWDIVKVWTTHIFHTRNTIFWPARTLQLLFLDVLLGSISVTLQNIIEIFHNASNKFDKLKCMRKYFQYNPYSIEVRHKIYMPWQHKFYRAFYLFAYKETITTKYVFLLIFCK